MEGIVGEEAREGVEASQFSPGKPYQHRLQALSFSSLPSFNIDMDMFYYSFLLPA